MSVTKFFVGNLPFSIDDRALANLFAPFCSVESAKVIRHRETGKSRGFGFVELDTDGAEAARKNLNGTEIEGRLIVVDTAKEERQPSRAHKPRTKDRNRRHNAHDDEL